MTSYPSPTFHSVFTTPTTNGEVPVLQPIKYIGTNHKVVNFNLLIQLYTANKYVLQATFQTSIIFSTV